MKHNACKYLKTVVLVSNNLSIGVPKNLPCRVGGKNIRSQVLSDGQLTRLVDYSVFIITFYISRPNTCNKHEIPMYSYGILKRSKYPCENHLPCDCRCPKYCDLCHLPSLLLHTAAQAMWQFTTNHSIHPTLWNSTHKMCASQLPKSSLDQGLSVSTKGTHSIVLTILITIQLPKNH
jgi:hypothetical protein